jgi:hypothetical protein
MSMKIGILAAAAMMFAGSAIAAPPSDEGAESAEQAVAAKPSEQAAPAAADAGTEAQEEKKICRTERATGSLTRRTRVCMTATQWREINSSTYKGVSEMQGSASGSQAVVNNAGPGG